MRVAPNAVAGADGLHMGDFSVARIAADFIVALKGLQEAASHEDRNPSAPRRRVDVTRNRLPGIGHR